MEFGSETTGSRFHIVVNDNNVDNNLKEIFVYVYSGSIFAAPKVTKHQWQQLLPLVQKKKKKNAPKVKQEGQDDPVSLTCVPDK